MRNLGVTLSARIFEVDGDDGDDGDDVLRANGPKYLSFPSAQRVGAM